jgi:hypothetical protein
MSIGAARLAAVLLTGCLISPLSLLAQTEQSPEELAIQQIKLLDPIGETDQARIGDWVRLQIERLAQVPEPESREAVRQFRRKLRAQYDDSRNTAAFKAQFAAQSARIGEQFLTQTSTPPMVAYAIARVLVDFNRAETLPGLLAGLKGQTPAARYLSARGIFELHSAIAGDKEKLERTISAVRDAALAETDPVALSQMYRALGVTAQPAQAFEAYISVLDKRAAEPVSRGSELEAFNFFRNPGVLGALNQAQKSQLAARLAVFLRGYSQQYSQAKLSYEEIDRLERLLVGVEELLESVAGAGGGSIRRVLDEGGYARRADVPAEAAKWIGDSQTNTAGVLNGPPWNVPIGGGAEPGTSARATGSTD